MVCAAEPLNTTVPPPSVKLAVVVVLSFTQLPPTFNTLPVFMVKVAPVRLVRVILLRTVWVAAGMVMAELATPEPTCTLYGTPIPEVALAFHSAAIVRLVPVL